MSSSSNDAKLFVGGLNFTTDEPCLEDAFSRFGNIKEAVVVRERESGKSRGFGFVSFECADDAKDAMEAMNGKTLDGRQIRVDQAGKSSGDRRGYRGGSSGGRGFFRGGRGRGSSDRGYGGSRFEQRSGGYGGSRDYYGSGRSQRGYGDRSGGSYRDGYDSYTSHE